MNPAAVSNSSDSALNPWTGNPGIGYGVPGICGDCLFVLSLSTHAMGLAG